MTSPDRTVPDAPASTAIDSPEEFSRWVAHRLEGGSRLIGIFGTALPGRHSDRVGAVLTAVLADGDEVTLTDVVVGEEYPALSAFAPGASWYERAIHDMFGVLPAGHPRLDPLVLPDPHTADGTEGRHPRPGSGTRVRQPLVPSEGAVPRYLVGEGLFTIPHGPVRSGVVESLEFLVETPGEDIPRIQMRVFAKHRGVEVAFEGRDALTEGVYLAERVEGTASVAHALAYCQALETLAEISVPEPAALVRTLHAELERIAGHLEVAARLCEAAALAVAQTRFTHHKEQVQRLRHDLCGSRFGRGAVVPGGVTPPHALIWSDHIASRVARLRRVIAGDRDAAMVTSSFLDRLRGTGLLASDRAAEVGAVGPVGRASGGSADVRRDHPYDAYRDAPLGEPATSADGDVQARLEVRWTEIDEAFELVDLMLSRLAALPHDGSWSVPVPRLSGRGVGRVEGPQGETVHVVEVRDGRLRRVWPRTPSFHNLLLFHDVFHTDVLTDFAFIEASFAVSNAGVVM